MSYIQTNSTTSITFLLPLRTPSNLLLQIFGRFLPLRSCSLLQLWLPFTQSAKYTKNTEAPSSNPPSACSYLSIIWLEVSSNWFAHHREVQTVPELCETRVICRGRGLHLNFILYFEKCVFVPVLKMRSHAAVWSCHVLVLRLLWSSTGVTIIMPKVLIILQKKDKEGRAKEKKKGLDV